jgi:hypothetical protein
MERENMENVDFLLIFIVIGLFFFVFSDFKRCFFALFPNFNLFYLFKNSNPIFRPKTSFFALKTSNFH